MNANKAAANGAKREVLDAGNYPARVAQVIDLGVQKQRPFEGKEKAPVNEIMVTYELVTEFLQDEDGNDDETKPRWVSERFPLYSLGSERAKSTVRYLALDPGKDCDGDWSLMVGKPCLVAVVNNVSKSNGKTYNNVGGVSLPIKGMVVPDLVNEPRVLSLDQPDKEVFDALPEWIQGIIEEGLDFPGSNAEAVLKGKAPVVKAKKAEVELDDASVPY